MLNAECCKLATFLPLWPCLQPSGCIPRLPSPEDNPAGQFPCQCNPPSLSNKIAAQREHPSVTMLSMLTPHRVPIPTLTHTENRTKKHQCVPLCIINVPSNHLNPPALGRHRPAREPDVSHALPLGGQAQLSQRPAQRWRSP